MVACAPLSRCAFTPLLPFCFIWGMNLQELYIWDRIVYHEGPHVICGVSLPHHISLPGLLTLMPHTMEAGRLSPLTPFPELYSSDRRVKVDREQTLCSRY